MNRNVIQDMKDIASDGKSRGKTFADYRKAINNYINKYKLYNAKRDILQKAEEIWTDPDKVQGFSAVDKTGDLLGATKAVGIGAVQGIPFVGELVDEAVAAAQAAAESLKQGDLEGFQEDYNAYYKQLHETGAWKDAKNHPFLSGATSIITGLLMNPIGAARGIADAALSVAGAIESQFITGTDRDKENAAKELKEMANAGLLVAGGAAGVKVGTDITKAFTKMGDQPSKTIKEAFERGREGHSLATRKDALKYKEKIDKDIADFQNRKINEMKREEKELSNAKADLISKWDKDNELIEPDEITKAIQRVINNQIGKIKETWTIKSKRGAREAIKEAENIWFGLLTANSFINVKEERKARRAFDDLLEKMRLIGDSDKENKLIQKLINKQRVPRELEPIQAMYNKELVKTQNIEAGKNVRLSTQKEIAQKIVHDYADEIESNFTKQFRKLSAKQIDDARRKAWEQSEYANAKNIMFGGQKGTIKKVTSETEIYGDIAKELRELLNQKIGPEYEKLNKSLNRKIIAKDIVKTNKLSEIVPTARKEFESVNIEDFDALSGKQYVTKFQFLKEYAPEVANEIVKFENDYIDPALRAFQAGADIRAQDLGDLAAYSPSVSFLRSLGSVAPRTSMFLGRQVGRAEKVTPEAIKEAARKFRESGLVKFAKGEGERQSRISRLQDVAEAIRSEDTPDVIGGAAEMVVPKSEAAMQGALNFREAVEPEQEIPKYIKRNAEGVESNSDLIQEILKMQEPMLFKEFVNAVNKDDKETAAKIAAEVSANHEEFFEPSPIQTATGARIKSAWSDHSNENAIKIYNPLEIKQMAHDITEKEDMSETEKMRAVQQLHKRGIIEKQPY